MATVVGEAGRRQAYDWAGGSRGRTRFHRCSCCRRQDCVSTAIFRAINQLWPRVHSSGYAVPDRHGLGERALYEYVFCFCQYAVERSRRQLAGCLLFFGYRSRNSLNSVTILRCAQQSQGTLMSLKHMPHITSATTPSTRAAERTARPNYICTWVVDEASL